MQGKEIHTMTAYYAETSGLSHSITIYRDCIAIDSITAGGDSLEAKEGALRLSGYVLQGAWVYTTGLPSSRFLAAIAPNASTAEQAEQYASLEADLRGWHGSDRENFLSDVDSNYRVGAEVINPVTVRAMGDEWEYAPIKPYYLP